MVTKFHIDITKYVLCISNITKCVKNKNKKNSNSLVLVTKYLFCNVFYKSVSKARDFHARRSTYCRYAICSV